MCGEVERQRAAAARQVQVAGVRYDIPVQAQCDVLVASATECIPAHTHTRLT